jgi:hypothetical protein
VAIRLHPTKMLVGQHTFKYKNVYSLFYSHKLVSEPRRLHYLIG